MTEPATPQAVAEWIAAAISRTDRFGDVRRRSEEHREEHGRGCTVYPTESGPLLGVLAAATGARRVLEVGCGLGYSALWLAFGSSPQGHVDTIEHDPEHAQLARGEMEAHGYAGRITVHVGRAADLVGSLEGSYDLVFCDADPYGYEALLEEFVRLLRRGGLLVSSNLFLAQFAPGIPHLDELARYRERITGDERLETAFVPGGMALSVLR